jgi:hypothetical protein
MDTNHRHKEPRFFIILRNTPGEQMTNDVIASSVLDDRNDCPAKHNHPIIRLPIKKTLLAPG